MNRRRTICLLFVAVALTAVIAGGLALYLSSGAGPNKHAGLDVAATDPCTGPRLDAQVTPTDGPIESVEDIRDGNEADAAEPHDSESAVASQEPDSLIHARSDADATPEPGGAIRGTVFRADGTPYVESLELTEMLRVQVKAPGYERACTIDESGRFECVGLDAGFYAVTVVDLPDQHRIPCHGINVDVRPEATSQEIALVLSPETTVTVRTLSDPDLQPVQACSVIIESTQGPAAATGRTDGQGLCEFSVAAGSYGLYALSWDQGQSIQVSPKRVVVRSPGSPVTVELLVPQREPEESLIDIALVDLEGHPVPGFVTLEGVVADPNAGPAASFSMPEPAFQPPGGLLSSACDVSGVLGRRFIWRKDPQGSQMTIVLEPGATIAGRVVGVDRKPVADARVSIETLMLDNRWSAPGDLLYTTVSDAEGYFQLDGVSVGPRIRVVAFLGTLSGRSTSLDLKAADIADAGQIVLTGSQPGSGIVRGRITDEQDSPVADRAVKIGIGRATQNLVTDADGYYTLTNMPTDRAITVTIEVPTYGVWSRTTVADDFACDFQLVPQGWNALGQEAPPLFADTWFNHAPMTLKDLRGRVVLLTFRNFTMDRDPGLATIRSLLTEFGSKGLLIIAVYDHLPGGSPIAQDLVTTHLTSLFEGAPIAGILDADPDLVGDLMPPGRPPGVTAGATHWLYQVHERPASFLIDTKGIVRHCTAKESDLRDWIERLLAE